MDFDVILKEIGDFGKYQITNYLLICFPVFFAAANSLSYVFTAGQPNYRCLVPECDKANPIYDEDWVNYAVPGSTVEGIFTPNQCERYKTYNLSKESYATCPAHIFSHDSIRCNEWVYDKHEHTIVEDWNLTCIENNWKLALVGTVHFAGIVVGSGSFGILADNYGRKLIFIFAITFMSITGICQALSKDYLTFLIFAFLNAVGTSGVFPLAFIIGVEMVGKTKREMSGVVLNYFYAIGEAFVGLIAWLSGDWVVLQYAVSAPALLFITYYWIIPESVRWLLAKKYNGKAIKIIKKAADVNNAKLSDDTLSRFAEDLECRHTDKFHSEKQKHEMWKMFKELYHSRIMICRCLILFYGWATNALVFYGLSLNSTNLSGNKYLNFILVCLVEIPGYSLAWITMNKIGRRWSLAGSLLICGATCVVSGLVPDDLLWLSITLFLIGKLGITSSFAVIYVHSAEMLPTIIRSGGVGMMSTVARVGAMTAPFVPLLSIYMSSLPLLVFGSTSFVAGLLALLLPETLNVKLPDTIEEAERIGYDEMTNV